MVARKAKEAMETVVSVEVAIMAEALETAEAVEMEAGRAARVALAVAAEERAGSHSTLQHSTCIGWLVYNRDGARPRPCARRTVKMPP